MSIRPDLEFQAFLKQGCFMLQSSRASGRHLFYPRVLEPGSDRTDLEWVPASGHRAMALAPYPSSRVTQHDFFHRGDSYGNPALTIFPHLPG